MPTRFASLMIICAIAVAAPPAAPPIDMVQAKAAFAEAEAVSNQEGGRLWGKKLYGALFFVDPETRYVVANEPDSEGVLHATDGVYVGTLPKEILVSNAPVEWQGKRWTMLMWPTLPSNTIDRRVIFAHELFHRIQPGLGLMAPDSPNLQLDTPEGRLWLQLEWRALAAALVEQGPAQIQAIRDALAFRSHRHELFAGSAQTEASLEIAEGVPEYTGTIAGEPDRDSARWRVIGKLTDPDQSITFVRSFAYTSGPPYGLLLDSRHPGWRTKLSVRSDLSTLLAATLPPSAAVSAEVRAPVYGAAAIRSAEMERARKAEAVKARYRARLVEGPTLLLPGGKKFAFSFNPSALVSLGDANTVYPTFHATAEWGTLDVTDGVLVPTDFSQATVAAPKDTQGPHLEGPGWTLELKAGWSVVPGARAGSYTVAKK
ncbi:MAG TPA: hypothetical protein VIY68_00530 [Steroidobacteraceae bacterium]